MEVTPKCNGCGAELVWVDGLISFPRWECRDWKTNHRRMPEMTKQEYEDYQKLIERE